MGSGNKHTHPFSTDSYMRTYDYSIPAVLKWAGALLVGAWLSIPDLPKLLLCFMVIDYITGVGCALVRGEISSAIGFKGLIRKALMFSVIVAAHLVERAMNYGFHVDNICSIAFICNEFISIVENCYRAGVPIPGKLVGVLLSVKKLAETATPDQMDKLNNHGVIITEETKEDVRK